ncbi:MAG: LPXTG cell wall anchor domain-containing protein [Chitinophagaceae bacterium]
MQKEHLIPVKQWYEPFLKATLFCLIAVYFVNCLSPLRLHVDTLRYFAVKDCIEFGCPPDSFAATDYLPYGYTALLIFLSKIGLLKSVSIILINCFYLFAGLWFVKKFFKLSSPLLILLVITNWTIIKFVTHPLSEMQYLFFSMGSLYFFYKYKTNKKILDLLVAFIFAVITFITRTVGVTLIGALALGVVWEYRKQLIEFFRKNIIWAISLFVVIVGVAIFSKQLGLNHYTGVFTKQFDEGLGISKMLEWHFTEWSELFLNTSSVKVLPYLPGSSGAVIFVIVGIALFAGFLYLLVFRKNNIPFYIKAYILFYSLLMFNWPFYDPRFWVPILPLIIGVIMQASFSKHKVVKWIMSLYLAAYLIMGVISIGYMTYTSLNKKVFARTQANGAYRNEYETIFYGTPQSDTAQYVNPATLDVLKRYNK